eukprot:TRINITY_DN3151_c0_g3_i1.p1 TRINITY_DN3151_c0_g3~~TRINITY_DN3151_c0_g3_i1.p1  ORF type:complete len:198 (+),score=35.43 TRINITY_DN3151_c0_g3_i1:14-607(+)
MQLILIGEGAFIILWVLSDTNRSTSMSFSQGKQLVSAQDKSEIVQVKQYKDNQEDDLEKRIKDAQELEKKLKYIQEEIPTRVQNVMGSNAGAGSGDFHQYRMARRREQFRIQRMEQDHSKHQEHEEFMQRRQERNASCEARTVKNRLKRHRAKEKEKAKKQLKKQNNQSINEAAAEQHNEQDEEQENEKNFDVAPLD